jgi:hypothetical protein
VECHILCESFAVIQSVEVQEENHVTCQDQVQVLVLFGRGGAVAVLHIVLLFLLADFFFVVRKMLTTKGNSHPITVSIKRKTPFLFRCTLLCLTRILVRWIPTAMRFVVCTQLKLATTNRSVIDRIRSDILYNYHMEMSMMALAEQYVLQ